MSKPSSNVFRLRMTAERKDWLDWEVAAGRQRPGLRDAKAFAAGYHAAISALVRKGVLSEAPIKEVLDFKYNGV